MLSESSNPASFVAVGSLLYFRAQTVTDGEELWRTDGTEAGTVLVKDIWPGRGGSEPSASTPIGANLFFAAADGGYAGALWKSDGSAAGTTLVARAAPTGEANSFCNVNGTLFFAGSDDAHGAELWRSDGTLPGTALVKDIEPGQKGSRPRMLASVGNTLFFFRSDPLGHFIRDLWKSDGTDVGTVLVRSGLGGQAAPIGLNGRAVLPGCDSAVGCGIWSSDGTGSGTALLKTTTELLLFPLEGVAYFPVDNDGSAELWKTDGTAAGTVLVATPLSNAGLPIFPYSFAALGGTLYFLGFDRTYSSGPQLWLSDGTEPGTLKVANVPKDAAGNVGQLTSAGGSLFFVVGPELWSSDGTNRGTARVPLLLDGHPAPSFANTPYGLTGFGGAVFFVADDGIHGWEPWRSDGTTAGTFLLRDIGPGQLHSRPQNLAVANGAAYFSANDGVHGDELWKSNGSASGTVLVKQIEKSAFNPNGSRPANFVGLGGAVLFTAYTTELGRELWKTDGTESGTALVKDIRPGSGWPFIQGMTVYKGAVYFAAADQSEVYGLWVSDGTESGTRRVVDPGAAPVPPFVELGGDLYFLALSVGGTDFELWKSDGTSSGTQRVKALGPVEQYNFPRSLTRSGSLLFFIAHEDATGWELWKSDGTESGTALVKDIFPGTLDSEPGSLTDLNGTLFFGANDSSGWELWASDGTSSGTRLVKAICPSCSYGSYPQGLVNVAGTLFFGAQDVDHGWELWKSDGTGVGTVLVKDIRTGPSGSAPGRLTALNGFLYFAASDAEHGMELWRSDGTSAGTVLVQDINPGPASSQPHDYVKWAFSGSQLVFVANDGLHGDELWILPLPVFTGPTSFFTVAPCRLLDTRSSPGPLGGPALAAGADRTFGLAGHCGLSSTAKAVAVNLTVVQPTASGDIRVYPGDDFVPGTSSVNYRAGQTRAGNGVYALGGAGDLAFHCDQSSGTVHVIVDVSGYFE
ncbi:MAG: ELWxxDGT repeat protein [Thermoanaerobaculia bacterium]